MKSFYTATVILILIAALITTLSFIISGPLDDIYEGVIALPATVDTVDGSADIAFFEILELSQKWDEHKSLVELTASYYDVLRADTEMRNLRAFAEFADNVNYRAAKSRLSDALDALRNSERLSLGNIL